MEKFEDNLTFEDIINQTFKKVKVGSTITGTIVEINGKGEIFVDIGYKADGIIPRNEYFSEKGLEPADEYKVGDKIKADVLKLNDGQGNVLMSCKHAKIKEIIKPGDVVLLSPASASWDQYNRCEERGDEFKKYVNTL